MDISTTELPGLGVPSPLSLLPPELEYAIFGWLQEDKSAAASCSLACRRWRRLGQSTLFHEVKLQRSSANRICNLLQFVGANQDIAGYIHTLSLSSGYEGSVPVDALRVAVEAMTHLHTLEITCLTLQFDMTPPPSPIRRSLKELAIVYCNPSSNRNISGLLSIICMFSDIGRLVVKGTSDDWTILSNIDHYLQDAPTVRSLKIYDLHERCISAVHAMVRASGSLGGQMSYLGICTETISSAVALADLVREAGRYLRTLKVRLEYDGWAEGNFASVSAVCHTLDLSNCNTLRTLHLHFWASGEEISFVPETKQGWLPSCFRASADLLTAHTLALRALCTVRITIDAEGAGNLALETLQLAGQNVHAAWRPLEAALMEIRTLGRVEVIVRDYGRLTEEEIHVVRGLVEEGLSDLIALHAGTEDFLHFECRK